MYYNVIPVLGSQIIKEMPLHGDKSYVNKIYVSNSLSVILGDYNPHMFESNGTLIPIGNFANPQIFNPDKIYYVILGDVDDLMDGYGHYIQYVGKYVGDMKPGIYPNYSMPLYANKDGKKIVNGFQGLIIGGCTRAEAILTYSGIGCPQFYYSDFLGVKCTGVLHLEVSKEIKIPINTTDEEKWRISKNFDELHVFSCRFGYQGANGEYTDYTHLNDYLYVSGVILDNDPNMLDLPKDKTYFEDLDY